MSDKVTSHDSGIVIMSMMLTILTLTVLVTTIDALRYFETG